MADYTDAAKAALDPDNIRQVFNGVIDLQFVNGTPSYRVGGKRFASLKDAVNYKNTAGISVVETFTPGKVGVDYATTAAGIPSGDQVHEVMRNYARRAKMKIHLHHLKQEDMDPGNLEKILEGFTDPKTGKLQGYLNVGKSSTFEQWEDKTGKLLTSEQIIKKQKKFGTVEKIFDGKIGSIAKRHKMDTRTAELTKTFDRRLTVGVYDPKTFLRGSGLSGMDDISGQMAKMSQDGISLLNPEIIDEIRKSKMAYRDDLIKAKGKLSKGSQEYANLSSEIKKVSSKISELRGVSTNGGLYNIRADIFDVAASSHYSGKLKDSMENLSGQLKGNVLVVPKRKSMTGQSMWEVAQGERGFDPKRRIDILTTAESIAQNKGEAVRGALHESTVLLDARKLIRDSWLDTQSWSAHPELFDTRRMQRATLDAFQKQADEIVTTGQLPQGMINAFREAVEKKTDLVGKTSASTQQAKAILEFVEAGGDLNQNPRMMELALGSMSAFYADGKNADRARFLVPNMVRHEVADFASLKSTLLGTESLPALNNLKRGTITLDKTGGFGLHNKDVAKFHEAFGGFDLDDMLAAHVRYDKDAGEYMLAMTRQPTTHGEIASFKFGEFDELAQQVLLKHDESYDFLDQIRGHDIAAERQVGGLERQRIKIDRELNSARDLQLSYQDALAGDTEKALRIDTERAERLADIEKSMDVATKKVETLEENIAKVEERHARIAATIDDPNRAVFGDPLSRLQKRRAAAEAELTKKRGALSKWEGRRSWLEERKGLYTASDEGGIWGKYESGYQDSAQIHDDIERIRSARYSSIDDQIRTVKSESKAIVAELKGKHSVKLREVVEEVSGDWRRGVDARSRANKYMPDLYQLVENKDGSIVNKGLTLKAKEKMKPFELKGKFTTATDDILRDAFSTMVTGQNELGRYSNTKMIMDAMLNDNADQMDEITRVLGKGFFGVPELEEVIDTQIKNAGEGLADDMLYSAALQRRIGEAAAILDAKGGPSLRLDEQMFRERAGQESKAVIREAYELAGGEGRFEDHLVDGAYTNLVKSQRAVKESIDSIVGNITGKIKYNDFYSTHTFSQDALEDAEFLTRAYSRAKEARKGAGPSFNAIQESFEDYGADILTGGLGGEEYSKKAARSLVGDDMLSSLGRIAERRGGHEGVYEALGALQQMHNDAPRSQVGRSARSILNARGESGAMLDVLNRTDAHFGIGSAAPRALDIAGLPTAPAHILESEAAFYGEKRLASSTIATKASQGLLSIGEGIAKLKEVPGVKAAAAIGLATIVGSFIYQHHKDHTPEDMSGPPLLPGGSAYENLPVESMPTRMSGYQQASEGDTYNVYASGSFDQQEFSDSIGAATGGSPSSVSVYKGRKPKHQGSMDAYVERSF